MGGKPSKGTRKDKRLKSNKSSAPFRGKRAALFKKGGGRR